MVFFRNLRLQGNAHQAIDRNRNRNAFAPSRDEAWGESGNTMPAQTIELPVATIRHLDQQVRRHSPRYFREVAAAGEYLYAKLIDAGKITEKEAGKEIAIDLSSGCFGIGATSSEALAHLDSPIQNRHIYFRTVTASREKSSA